MAKQNFMQLSLPGMELEDMADDNTNSNTVTNPSNARKPKRKGLRIMVYGLIGAMTLGVGYGGYLLSYFGKGMEGVGQMGNIPYNTEKNLREGYKDAADLILQPVRKLSEDSKDYNKKSNEKKSNEVKK